MRLDHLLSREYRKSWYYFLLYDWFIQKKLKKASSDAFFSGTNTETVVSRPNRSLKTA